MYEFHFTHLKNLLIEKSNTQEHKYTKKKHTQAFITYVMFSWKSN